jgi:hypothetical protein
LIEREKKAASLRLPRWTAYHLDMGRKHPRFSYSELSDPSDVLLRQEPEEEEDEEEEDDDNDDNDEENDGYSARPCLIREG